MILRWTRIRSARHSADVAFLLALLGVWFGGMPAAARSVDAIDVSHDRIVVRFDEGVSSAASFLLDQPTRIALDIDGTGPGASAEPAGLVAGVRQSGRGNDGTRIVFDLVRPAIVTGGRLSDDGRKLTLSVQAVDGARFARATTAGRMRFVPKMVMASVLPASSSAAMIVDRGYRVSVPVPSHRRQAKLPEIRGNADRPLVVIDAGHGGHDPGAISPHGGLREKDLTLKVARAIRDALLDGGRVRVALTRDRDEFLVLQERYALARRMGASLFISVHCDSAENPLATGASIYTLSEVASDREAARLAARENKADILAGLDLGAQSADISSILIDLTQRETMNASAGFARLLGREASGLIPLKPNYHRMASLMVLKAPDLPSILFETGYLSNEADAERLASADGRRAIAKSVQRAVEVHFARRMASR